MKTQATYTHSTYKYTFWKIFMNIEILAWIDSYFIPHQELELRKDRGQWLCLAPEAESRSEFP
jgi:hypothetical protein